MHYSHPSPTCLTVSTEKVSNFLPRCRVPCQLSHPVRLKSCYVLYYIPGRVDYQWTVAYAAASPVPLTPKRKKKDFNHTSSLAFRTMTDGLRLTAAYAAASPVPLTYDFNHSTSSLEMARLEMQCITHTYYSHSPPLDHLSSMELRPLTGKYWAAATLLLLAAALMLSTSCFASSIAKASPPAATATNFSDHSVLLTFRSLITKDPFGALSSWGNKSLHFCRWQGVACGKHGHRRGRVVGLDLGSLGLVGTISPSISNLTYLRKLHMPMNQFSGHIPHELGLLGDLKHLNLSDNALGGEIPVDLSRCSKLQTISLWYNNLQGTIPANLSRCSVLRTIELFANYLEGEIPSEIGTLQNLELLNLFDNGLNGSIPP